MTRRPLPRTTTPVRKPWHADYLIMRRILRSIEEVRDLANGTLLDVGCGERPYEPWLTKVDVYIGVDVTPGVRRADVIARGDALPFADESFDTVWSSQALEHMERPVDAVREMARVLKRRGALILTVPQAWRLHEEPHDYFRFTRHGLRHILEQSGLSVEKLVAHGGVWTTVGSAINNAVNERISRVPILKNLIFATTNVVCGALDVAWLDQADTPNYLVVARKR